jgi:diguanylate cyclase (GGDEF)-like protein
MLAQYLICHLRRAWAPLTYTDENPPPRDHPVAAANRSDTAAATKTRTYVDPDGAPIRSFRGLLDHLATLTPNTALTPNTTVFADRHLDILATPTPTNAAPSNSPTRQSRSPSGRHHTTRERDESPAQQGARTKINQLRPSLGVVRCPRFLGGRGGRGARLWEARIAFAAVALVAVLSYEVVLSAPVALGLIGLDGVAAIGIGVAIFRPQRWLGWVLIGAAVALFGTGAVLFTLSSNPLVHEAHPQPWDVLNLVAYLPMAVGLLLLGRPRVPSQEWPVVLDIAVLSLGASLVGWIEVLQPAFAVTPVSGVGRVTMIASWVGYVTLLAIAVRVFLVWRTNVSLALLATAVGSLLAAEFFSAKLLVRDSSSTGTAVHLGFIGLSLVCGAAALTASMSRVASPGRNQVSTLRLGMVGVGLLVAPTALLVQATSGAVTTGVAIGVVSAAVAVLMLVRAFLAVQDAGRRAQRDRTMRVASREFMVATTREQVVAAVARAVASIIPPGAVAKVALRTNHEARPASADDERTADTDPDVDEIVLELASDPQHLQRSDAGSADTAQDVGSPVLIVRAPAEDLAELNPVLRGLADQAASALHRTELLAVLQAEERERYFRTLVLTSDDVTMISRGGVVAYATPSALGMFGQDITGHPIDELLDGGPAPPGGWTATTGAEATVPRADGEVIAWVRSRDLHGEPTVNGVVTTLRDITAERHLQADLAFRASHDPLTGLANAQLFSEELHVNDDAAGQFAERRRQSGSGRAALFIDLDDFKAVNDTYGHEVGDRLLAEVARRIQACLRADDLAARLGGDEFAVLLRNVAGVDAARDVAERIGATLAAPARVDHIMLTCQASIGLAYHSGSGRTDTLLREADSALYSAKAAGKGQSREYHHGMPIPARQRSVSRSSWKLRWRSPT